MSPTALFQKFQFSQLERSPCTAWDSRLTKISERFSWSGSKRFQEMTCPLVSEDQRITDIRAWSSKQVSGIKIQTHRIGRLNGHYTNDAPNWLQLQYWSMWCTGFKIELLEVEEIQFWTHTVWNCTLWEVANISNSRGLILYFYFLGWINVKYVYACMNEYTDVNLFIHVHECMLAHTCIWLYVWI